MHPNVKALVDQAQQSHPHVNWGALLPVLQQIITSPATEAILQQLLQALKNHPPAGGTPGAPFPVTNP